MKKEASKVLKLDIESREVLIIKSKRKDVLEVLSQDRDLAKYIAKSLDKSFFGDVVRHLRENLVSVDTLTDEWIKEIDRQKMWETDCYVDGMCLHTLGRHIVSLGDTLTFIIVSSYDRELAKTSIKEWLKATPLLEMAFALKSAMAPGTCVENATQVLKILKEEGYEDLLLEIMNSGIVYDGIRERAYEIVNGEELSISDFL